MSFRLKAVDVVTLSTLVAESPHRGRPSKGGELLQEFLASGMTAATVDLGSTDERNSTATSAARYADGAGLHIWLRKLGGPTGTELLMINLSKADAATRRAYENRPRPARRRSGR